MSNYADVESFSARERLAIEFSEQFALSHTDLDEDMFERLREHFSAAEIVELSATVGFCMGIGRIYTVLDIAHECRLIH